MSDLYERVAERHRIGHELEHIELCWEARAIPATLRDAAVLAAITDRDEPGMLLIHRPSNMRAHPGQVALPGGKVDAGEDAVTAALREAQEELGINPTSVRVIGTGDTYATHSGFAITPVIGLVPPDLHLTPNPHEVAQWFEAPLDFLMDARNHCQQTLENDGRQHRYWEITWQGHRIWGVTAGLIVNISRRLRWHG